jgi:hypothetical protein
MQNRAGTNLYTVENQHKTGFSIKTAMDLKT